MVSFDFKQNDDIAWCPGCGNFNILNVLKNSLGKIGVKKNNIVMVSGIGQAAKMPQYIDVSYFNGLHGRALPVATAVKAANPKLTVIAESGDGDMYGEGGNHFMHNIRRNVDITNIVHNNMVYGLTKGQASPTSQKGFVTPVQVDGVMIEPANPLALAIAYGATFVARAYSNDIEQFQDTIIKAIKHKGYSLVEVLHPCVTFNKLNNHKWYKENSYYLDNNYDNTNKKEALNVLIDAEKLALGIIFEEKNRATFTDELAAYKKDKRPLYERDVNIPELEKLVSEY